jgi:hypothetical protein
LNTYVYDWLIYLRDSHGAAAFPLIVTGLGLMLFGWRLRRLCVVLSFAAIGAGLVLAFVPQSDNRWLYALIAAIVLGAASYGPAAYAVALLGGIIGAVAVMLYLSMIGLQGAALWCLTGAALVLCTAYAIINRRRIVVVLTAFLGAVLLMSGLTSLTMTSPAIYGWFEGLSHESVIFAPFVILVPTVMSCFYQMGEVKRSQMTN